MNQIPNYIKVVIIAIVIWAVQNSPFFWGAQQDHPDGSEFTAFVYKGSIGHSMDNVTYGHIIRSLSESPSFYRPDNLIAENKGKHFPDSSWIMLAASGVYKITGNLMLTIYILSFLSILLTVLVLLKLLNHFEVKSNWLLLLVLSFLLFLTSYEDWLGLVRMYNNIGNGHLHKSFGMHLGYAQRFPVAQVSLLVLVLWIYRLLKFLKESSLANGIFFSLSLVLLQYSYFYYWSYALLIAAFFFVLNIKQSKKWMVPILIYIVLILPFWLPYFQFNQTEFAAEYIDKVKGKEMYPMLGIHIIGLICSLFSLKDQKLIPTIISLSSFVLAQLAINFALFNFQPFHWMFWVIKIGAVLSLIINLVWWSKLTFKNNVERLLLLNYVALFVLLNLKFFVGFNIQPYHWVISVHHPVLMIAITWLLFQVRNIKKGLIGLSVLILITATYNSFSFGKMAGKYWSLSQEELEVIEYVESQEKPVLLGNNYPFLLTVACHSSCDLFMGATSGNMDLYSVAYHRFITNFKEMGYSDYLIVNEYNKYKDCDRYEDLYMTNKDSLRNVWPDNTLLAAEALHHCFMNPQTRLAEFKEALYNYNSSEYYFNKDLLIIYKPTYRGSSMLPVNQRVFNSKNYSIYRFK